MLEKFKKFELSKKEQRNVSAGGFFIECVRQNSDGQTSYFTTDSQDVSDAWEAAWQSAGWATICRLTVTSDVVQPPEFQFKI